MGQELLPGNSTEGSGVGVRLLRYPWRCSTVAPSPEEMDRGSHITVHSEPYVRHYSKVSAR